MVNAFKRHRVYNKINNTCVERAHNWLTGRYFCLLTLDICTWSSSSSSSPQVVRKRCHRVLPAISYVTQTAHRLNNRLLLSVYWFILRWVVFDVVLKVTRFSQTEAPVDLPLTSETKLRVRRHWNETKLAALSCPIFLSLTTISAPHDWIKKSLFIALSRPAEEQFTECSCK